MIRRMWGAGILCVALGAAVIEAQNKTRTAAASACAAAGTAAAGGKRRTRRISAGAAVARPDAGVGAAEERGVHRRYVGQRRERRGVPLPARRPHPRRRARAAASGSSARTACSRQPLAGMPPNMFDRRRAEPVRGDARPGIRHEPHRLSRLRGAAARRRSGEAAVAHAPDIASAKLSADDSRLEGVKVLLDAEGTSGRVMQANDGTLLVTSTVPAGLGINSEDWLQPQQLDSNMGKVLRINTDGSIPKDNPFVGTRRARIPRSTRSASGTSGRGHPSAGPAGCGRASTAREAATRSTPSRKGRTTASRRSAMGANTPASRSTATRPRRPAWNSRCISGRRISRRRASASIPASCFPHGTAICSSRPGGRSTCPLVLNGKPRRRRRAPAGRSERAHPRRQRRPRRRAVRDDRRHGRQNPQVDGEE